jgi:hypothetical protein
MSLPSALKDHIVRSECSPIHSLIPNALGNLRVTFTTMTQRTKYELRQLPRISSAAALSGCFNDNDVQIFLVRYAEPITCN